MVPLRACLLIFFTYSLLDGRQVNAESTTKLTGDNICKKERFVSKTVKEPYEHSYTTFTTESCLDPTQGFKCKKEVVSKRTLYRDKVIEVPVEYEDCCDGYAEYNGKCIAFCEPACVHGSCVAPMECECVTGYMGINCSDIIQSWYAIDNTLSPSLIRGEPQEAGLSAASISIIIVSLVALLLLLTGLVLYYRRKYRDEKDPPLPTVRYDKEDPYSMATNGIYAGRDSGNEFDNPSYGIQNPGLPGPAHGYANPLAGAASSKQSYLDKSDLKGYDASNGSKAVYAQENVRLLADPYELSGPGSGSEPAYATSAVVPSGADSEHYDHIGTRTPVNTYSNAGSNEYETPSTLGSGSRHASPDTFSAAPTERIQSPPHQHSPPAPSSTGTSTSTEYERIANA